MRIIELVNDTTLAGIGLLSVQFGLKYRSLFGVFFQKEDRLWIINLFYIELVI